MFTRFRIHAIFLVALWAAFTAGVYSQRIATVNINTQLTAPPYTVPLDEFAGKVRLTILSNAGMEGVFLTMSINGDNGIHIESNRNQIYRFYISSGVPLVLPDADFAFDYLFMRENLNFSGVNPALLYDYGLPPGNYDICFRLWAPTDLGDMPVSPAAPAGCASFSIQQPVVNISTVVKPPWDANFMEYYQKTLVTLNTSRFSEVFLRMRLEGNNGIRIQTPSSYFPSEMILLEANVPQILTGSDLWDVFNADKLQYSGISASEVQENGLPAGTYTLCFSAYNRNGQQVTAGPAGCSNPFTLRLLDPPVIISPQCGKIIDTEAAGPVIFSWSPSPGAPPLTPYTLRIVEINDPNTPPGEALQTATTPAFFEETVPTTSYLYGPAQPELEKGKTYAFQVIAGTEALDIENPYDFNSDRLRFKNKGMSEPCYFTYGKTEVFFQPVFAYIPPEPEVTPVTPDPNILPYTTVSGQLNYKFKKTGASVAEISTPDASQAQVNIPGGGEQEEQGEMAVNSGIMANLNQQSSSGYNVVATTAEPDVSGLTSALGYIDPAGSKPLGNVSVSLEVKYIMVSGSVNGGNVGGKLARPSMFIDQGEFENHFPDDGKILQTTQTAADGSFNFVFVNPDTTFGEIQDLQISSSTEIGDRANASFMKTLRLIINNPYFCSPDVNFSVKPWKQNDYGTLVSYVKSYNLLLHVKSTTATFYDQKVGSGTPLNDVHARILRSQLIPGVPFDEGEAGNKIPPMAGMKKQIADDYSNSEGKVLIPNLVMHDPDNNNDRYYIQCSTPQTSGNISYKEFKRRYSPVYLKDKKNFPFNSMSKELVTIEPGENIYMTSFYEYYGLDITFNSEFEVRTYEYTAEMYPEKPRVYGQAFVSGMKDLVNWDNAMQDTIKPGVKVLLFSQYKKAERVPESEKISGTLSIKNTYTDSQGRYSFEKLPMELDLSGWTQGDPSTYKAKVAGPERWIVSKPNGFGLIEKDLNILKYGDQVQANLILNPDGITLGYVVDEEGNPVPSSVKVESYPAVKTGKAGLGTALALAGTNVQGMDQLSSGAEMFAFIAPSSESSSLRIIPDNLNRYAPLDTSVRIAKLDDGDPGSLQKFVVKKIMHRPEFRVMGYTGPPGTFQLAPKPLEGVKVKVEGIIENVEGITDSEGYVTLEFIHSEELFKLKIIPPEQSDYPVSYTGFSSTPGTKNVFKKRIDLFPAFKINGIVTIGDMQEAADSVKVYVDGNPEIFTYTGPGGKFLLRKIPPEFKSCIVKAEKYDPEITIIGDASGELSLPYNKQVNLHLALVPEMPPEIFGFPVAIDSVKKTGDKAVISGTFINPEKFSSANFSLLSAGQVQLTFSGLEMTRSEGEKTFRPAANKVKLDADKLDLKVNGAFIAEQRPSEGSLLYIEKSSEGKGSLKGKVMLKNSFSFNAGLFSFKEGGAWLTSEGDNTDIAVFGPPSPMLMRSRKLFLVNKEISNVPVNLKSFDGFAKRGNSCLSRDTLVLALQLKTKEIENISPPVISIDIDKLKLTNKGFETVTGTEDLSFNLEKWQVVAKEWKLSQGSKGLEIASATLKTGMVDLPVGKIEITPNTFNILQITLKDMRLSGIVPVKLESNEASFGYFNSIGKDQKGHWRLTAAGFSGKPAVSIEGLPGLPQGKKVNFSTFAILSNGEQSLEFMPGTGDLEFYTNLKVKPIAIYPYSGYFLLDGAMDLGIPRIEKQNGSIKFSKSGGELKFELYPLNMDFEGPGKVRFYSSQTFGDQKFDQGTFLAPGIIRDEEGIRLMAKLHRNNSRIWLEVDPYNQVIPIGSNGKTRLMDIRGEMSVDNQAKDWELFEFEGIMEGVKGMEGDRKKDFTIYGDIVANNQDVKVKNIDSGFGNLNITFDYKNARMIGDMDINKSFAGMTLHGVANMLVDGQGWYFLAGGQAEAPGLGNFQAGFMIGDYALMPADVTTRLMQFAYDKTVPASFSNNISGMFITGQKSLPIIDIPDISIDLWVLSAKLGVDAGMDARIWMGFDQSGNEYGIGAMAFAHAYFVAGSITCTSLSGDARAEMGSKGIYQTSTGAFSVSGCGSFSLAAKIEQCFPTVVAGCEGCTGKTLYESIKMNMLLDSQGNTNLSFGFGNCSGQNSLSSGW